MDRSVPLACCGGLLVSIGAYWLFGTGWFVSVATGAAYAAAGYFWLATEASPLVPGVAFENRTDRLAYAVGVFGVSVTPLALADHYVDATTTAVPMISYLGVIAFLSMASAARRSD